MKPAFYPVLLASLPTLSFCEIVVRGGGILLDKSLSKNEATSTKPEASKPDPAGDDLILFDNGDVMHGIFGGIQDGLLWERKDIDRPIKFSIPGIRQVVFKGSSGVVMEKETSFITLVSGDRIPGEIVSLDDKSLVVKSSIVGNVTIPREHIESLSPNPFDGELFYSGPYNSNGWMILDYRKTEKKDETETKEKAALEKKPKKEANEENNQEESSAWIHSGASFYSLDNRALVYPDANMPDIGRLKFKAEWKGRLNLTLALHSDFIRVLPPEKKEEPEDEAEEAVDAAKQEGAAEEKPEEKEEPEELNPAPLRKEKLVDLRKGNGFQNIAWIDPSKRTHADMFGTGYTMTLYSSYPNLSRNYFSETGVARTQRMASVRSNISLSEGGNAEIEIRYNRKESIMILFINGNYAAQWNDLGGFPGDGTGFGIVNNTSNARVRVSEVMITSWNGMTDSANSMVHPDRDLVLLGNGTDRFSGQVIGIKDGVALLKSAYMNAEIPIKDLSKIVLKESSSTDLDSDDLSDALNWEEEPITIVYKPFGKIKLNPVSAKNKLLRGSSPFLGKITVDLSSAAMLRFIEGSPDLSDWFDDL
ncbi:MAG: hypothetical protein P8M04_06035 [Akkermansiaceae bacterium]|nr:hypothetical protein [Akkermansiaceae bacterium]